MAIVINMPRLSDTMTEGVVAKWHKQIGDSVNEGDLLAEIETDKATMEFEAFPGQEGKLLYIGTGEGESAPVDTVLAILGEDGEDIEALKGGEAPVVEEKTPVAEMPAPLVPEPVVETPAPVAASTPAAAPVAIETDGSIKASPLARKLAADKGVDLSMVKGSGDHGRIVKRDIDSFNPAIHTSPQPGVASAPSVPAGVESFTDTPVSQMRKVIASRLSESKNTAPHFYVTMDIDMDNAIAARKAMNAGGEVKISFNDLVVKACALALKKHPVINSSWMGDFIRSNHHVHIGVAVAIEDGLLVPVLRHADQMPLAAISASVKDLAGKAKDKKLQPADWEGNTFTISNLGMFGVEQFTAIVNPPDAGILAVGGIKQVPVVKDGQVVPGNVMKVTLSLDHRAADGASGAAFLQTVKGFLENPVTMLV
ncbi:MAG: pyruvate dehydrogenase complex dihydrolipoamide acetyltransferase [Bacteroidetes bacterium]|jgi:pyruvate dehydrogenase E2 component (dihydrolipoamide acetyltransferase)|nr:pyruvate dehydrogenase complex dihydrolipoamide acetyltransferase [Bacteroidota bacterium]MDC3345964.1 pyruvate dehydrogenase complex dihydrolipoamide acetyltransferase [Schleiferiaceae bacterium]PTL96957.1 MAG: pyruvate dehydrogenase complex dihydrolipoamide acetyltransferase [Bacteroidota bacterium]PTL98871.1 MAG: pyruvate dehydrogenase complex dihydrolipoamide acetyltransferase [Bacteroidota bacterium]PTM16205.1 MAG: pyruvate dehydrogenase complex dihydrolipoamide acetyltransferase [Bacte